MVNFSEVDPVKFQQSLVLVYQSRFFLYPGFQEMLDFADSFFLVVRVWAFCCALFRPVFYASRMISLGKS